MSKIKTVEEALSLIKETLAKVNDELSVVIIPTEEEAKVFRKTFMDLSKPYFNKELTEEEEARYNAASESLSILNKVDYRDRLEVSLTLPLYLVEEKYLITNSPPVSPAGLHPTQGVFTLEGDYHVQVPVLPRYKLPNLTIYDMSSYLN